MLFYTLLSYSFMEFTLEKFSTFNDKGRIKGKRSQYVTFEFAGKSYNPIVNYFKPYATPVKK